MARHAIFEAMLVMYDLYKLKTRQKPTRTVIWKVLHQVFPYT